MPTDNNPPAALIVEDEPEANNLLSMLVQLRGYQTDSAFTGGEAINLIRTRKPDVVLLDLMLPDIHGFEICRLLKSKRETNAIPVVLVTARLAADVGLEGRRAGISRTVQKPYTPDLIFDALAAAADWKRDLEDLADSGRIVLDADDESSACEEVSRLWSLLLSRTRLDEESIQRVGQSLLDLVRDAVAWGRERRIDRIAVVDYRIEADRLVLEARDESAWFTLDVPPRERFASLIALGGFRSLLDNPCDGFFSLGRSLKPIDRASTGEENNLEKS